MGFNKKMSHQKYEDEAVDAQDALPAPHAVKLTKKQKMMMTLTGDTDWQMMKFYKLLTQLLFQISV